MSVQPNHATEPELLTPGAVAAILYVDPKTVTRWARAGKIASIRTPGGHRRYRRADIEAMGGAHSRSRGDARPEGDVRALVRELDVTQEAPPRPQDLVGALPGERPWAAAELAEAVAGALKGEAERSIEALWLAQSELEAAENAAYEATSRALAARARADAELHRGPRATGSSSGSPPIPAQRRPAPSPTRAT